jgi:hypothetical protein
VADNIGSLLQRVSASSVQEIDRLMAENEEWMADNLEKISSPGADENWYGDAILALIGQFGAVQIVAPSLGVEVSPVDVRDADEIERAVAAFARGLNGGLIVTGSALGISHRDLIIGLGLSCRSGQAAAVFGSVTHSERSHATQSDKK